MTPYVGEDGIEYVLLELQRVDHFLIEIRPDEIDIEARLPGLPNSVNAIFELRACVERPSVLGEYHGGTVVLNLLAPHEGVPVPSRYSLNAYDAALWVIVKQVPVLGYLGICHTPANEGRAIFRQCRKKHLSGVPVMIHDYNFSGDFVVNKFLDLHNTGVPVRLN
jgi:hypothetical protein